MKIMKKAASFLSLVPIALAQDETIQLKPGGDFADLDFTVPQLIQGAIRLIMAVGAIIFFFMLVIGGIRWIVSGGDKAQTEGARNQVTAALVGLVIVFAAWAIVQLLSTFFGIDIFGGLEIPKIKDITQ